jgi:predicted nucleic acid-binding protein
VTVRVIVDTPVWSLAFRRRRKDVSPVERRYVLTLRELIGADRTILIGAVRQEVLSGLTNAGEFERLRSHLAEFADEAPLVSDYEEAARCRNVCISAGIAGSGADMLICAVSMRLEVPILTTDRDFERYAAHLPLWIPAPHDLADDRRGRSDDRR